MMDKFSWKKVLLGILFTILIIGQSITGYFLYQDHKDIVAQQSTITFIMAYMLNLTTVVDKIIELDSKRLQKPEGQDNMVKPRLNPEDQELDI